VILRLQLDDRPAESGHVIALRKGPQELMYIFDQNSGLLQANGPSATQRLAAYLHKSYVEHPIKETDAVDFQFYFFSDHAKFDPAPPLPVPRKRDLLRCVGM
jgi:hypothetical protein